MTITLHTMTKVQGYQPKGETLKYPANDDFGDHAFYPHIDLSPLAMDFAFSICLAPTMIGDVASEL